MSEPTYRIEVVRNAEQADDTSISWRGMIYTHPANKFVVSGWGRTPGDALHASQVIIERLSENEDSKETFYTDDKGDIVDAPTVPEPQSLRA